LQKQKYLQRKNIFHDKMQFYLDNKVIWNWIWIWKKTLIEHKSISRKNNTLSRKTKNCQKIVISLNYFACYHWVKTLIQVIVFIQNNAQKHELHEIKANIPANYSICCWIIHFIVETSLLLMIKSFAA
jgi:hypothetical protein